MCVLRSRQGLQVLRFCSGTLSPQTSKAAVTSIASIYLERINPLNITFEAVMYEGASRVHIHISHSVLVGSRLIFGVPHRMRAQYPTFGEHLYLFDFLASGQWIPYNKLTQHMNYANWYRCCSEHGKVL